MTTEERRLFAAKVEKIQRLEAVNGELLVACESLRDWILTMPAWVYDDQTPERQRQLNEAMRLVGAAITHAKGTQP